MNVNKKFVGQSFQDHLSERMKNPVFAEGLRQERIKHEIAYLIKSFRQKVGLSQKQLAELTGLKQSAISRIESRTGKRIPSIEILRRIFNPLGYEIDYHVYNLKKAN